MNEKPTGKTSAKTLLNWKRLRSSSDREIRSAIEKIRRRVQLIPASGRRPKSFLPQPKQTFTMRLDAGLLAWLRRQKGYQTRINAVLRTYMDAQKP